MESERLLTARARKLWRAALSGAMRLSPVRRGVRELARRGHVPRRVYNRLPIVDDVFAVHLPGGQSFSYRALPGDAIGQALYFTGLAGWEAATIRVFLALARDAHFLADVGANTGVYTLLACAVNPALLAVAYEPVERVFDSLEHNVALNHFGDRVRRRRVAVTDRVGTTRFHVPHTAMPSSASLSQSGFRNIRGQIEEVPVTTVDADIPPDQRVDLVKIDVEGFEHTVLGGMQRILSEDRPAIICECNPDGPHARINELLRECDYVVFHVRAPGPERMPRIIPDPSETYRNFACVPGEAGEIVDLVQAVRI